MSKKIKRNTIVVFAISVGLMQTLTGCGAKEVIQSAFGSELQEQRNATKQEVMDYYSKSMRFQTVSKRTPMLTEQVNASYNTVESGTETYEKLKKAFTRIEAEHQKVNGYTIDEGLHDFLKCFLDDMVLSDGEIKRVKEYGGYYYMTVAYKTTPNLSGSFKNQANYIGIDGFITRDAYNAYQVNTNYITNALDTKINPYLTALGKPALTNYGADDSWVYEGSYLAGTGMSDVTAETETQDASTEVTAETQTDTEETESTAETEESTEDTGDTGDTTTVDETSVETPNEPNADGSGATNVATVNQKFTDVTGAEVDKTGINNIDRLDYDIDTISDIIGASIEQIALIPPINMVYNPAATQGRLNGFGMYKEGKAGLSTFNVAQNDLNDPGDIVITYIFKQNILEPDKMDYVSMYVNEYNSNNKSIEDKAIGGSLTAVLDKARLEADETGIDEDSVIKEFTGPKVSVPTFIEDKLNQVLEEFDRAVNDKQASALMDGDIIEDAGLGMKYAAYAKSADVVTFKSDLKRIVARHGNDYLLEVERTIEDGPADSGTVGQYRDTYFVVVRQIGTEFKYNDEMFIRRVNTNVPVVAAENTSIRRLVTLNLSGSVDTNTAKDITDTVLAKLASSLSGKMEDRSTDYQNLFDTDTKLLNDERRDYIDSRLQGQIFYKGYNASTNYIIKPSEWISGTEQQVEFTTKEFIKYDDGKLGGMYIENYYLVSKYGTSWVIDDIINMDTKVVDADNVAEYEQLVNSTVAQIKE